MTGSFLDSDGLLVAILVMIAAEGLALVLWHRRTGNALRPMLVLSFLGAGAAFIAALFFHRRAGGALGFGLSMIVALLMHLWHVVQLARGPAPR